MMQTVGSKRVLRESWGQSEAAEDPSDRRVKDQPDPVPRPLAESEEQTKGGDVTRHEALLRLVSDIVLYVRKDGVILHCRGVARREPCLDPASVVGKRVKDLLPPQMGQRAIYHIEKALRTGGVEVFPAQYSLPAGLRDFEVRVTRVDRDEVVALVQDVSDRRLMQKEILEASQRERTRIGQDLHDGLGQHLTGITFLTRALQHKLEARGLPEAQEAAEIGRLVIQALSQTRNLARGLFPVEIVGDDLVPAFKELASTAENLFQISCRVECEADWPGVNGTVATHVFRLAQEAISNSVKHGKAKLVVIRLRRLQDRLELSIMDNGVGLSQEGQRGQGLGLRIMNYRAQKIGGVLEIVPGPGGGTEVRCVFPASSVQAS